MLSNFLFPRNGRVVVSLLCLPPIAITWGHHALPSASTPTAPTPNASAHQPTPAHEHLARELRSYAHHSYPACRTSLSQAAASCPSSRRGSVAEEEVSACLGQWRGSYSTPFPLAARWLALPANNAWCVDPVAEKRVGEARMGLRIVPNKILK